MGSVTRAARRSFALCRPESDEPFWVKGRAGDVHVHPTGDPERQHWTDQGGMCWCGPSVDYESPMSGGRLICHKEMDC